MVAVAVRLFSSVDVLRRVVVMVVVEHGHGIAPVDAEVILHGGGGCECVAATQRGVTVVMDDGR